MARGRGYADHLATVPLFSALSKRELQQVARAADEIDVQAGRELVTEGRVGREFFLILDGRATVRRNNRKVASLGPGRYFGELALLDRKPRSATVVADTDMTLLVLGQREFAGLVESIPGMASKLLAGTAQRLREADAHAVSH
jgi:CRP/FNR family transcriptional regulator, cyclic AMP receptor protein